MKETLTPEQKETAVKYAMAEHLDAFFRASDTDMESVSYYAEPDAFRFKQKNGYAFLVSAAKRGTNNFLCEAFLKLKEWAESVSARDWVRGPTHFFGNVKERPE
jgi:hypothetical protein